MKSLNKSFLKIAIFLIVFIFTFILRAHNYDKTPPLGHLEELLYGWSGIYLIEEGVPVSWSTLDYPKRAEIFKGEINFEGREPKAGVTLYKPWLDEPPLFSLLVGLSAHLHNADRHSIIHTAYLRLPSILIATVVSIMIFIVAKMISGYWIGITAMIIYGVTPISVFASRMAVPENLIALIFISLVYLLIKFDLQPKFIYLLPIPLLVGIAGLSKPTGFFLLPFALYFVFSKKLYTSCLYITFGVLIFIGLYFLYGSYYDWEIFWKIFSIQSYRPVGFSSLGWFFVSPSYDIYTLQFVDGWYIFSLLTAFYFLLTRKDRKEWIVTFAFVYWLMVVILTGGEGDLLPWYRFPMLPLLAIFGAWGYRILVSRADFMSTVLATGLLIGSRHLVVNVFRPNISPNAFRSVFSIIIFPSIFYSIFQRWWLKILCKAIILGVIIVGCYFNVVYIYNQFEIVCEGAECPFGTPTQLSAIRFPFIWRWIAIGETPKLSF